MVELVGPSGKPVSSAMANQHGMLDMPFIVTYSITAVVKSKDEVSAKLGMQRLISVGAPLIQHVMEITMDAVPMPPEMMAEIMARQQGLQK